MRLSLIFLVALCALLLLVPACSKEQSHELNNPTQTNGVVEDSDEENAETSEKNNEIEIAECNTAEINIDYIFSHLKPNMPRSELVDLFGNPCAQTYTSLYTDYSIEWRYDFGQANNYDFPSTDGNFSYVDEQGLKSEEIAAQVFIGWNENDTVKYAEISYMKDGELITEMIYPDGFLKENHFFVKTVRVGDVISGLTVESVEPFIPTQGEATIHFSGEIELSGTYRYYTDDEKGMEHFDLYIFLDEESIHSIPIVHHNVPDLLFLRVGVTNSDVFLNQIERVGKEGRFKGTFANYTIQHFLFKPTEDTIEVKEIFLYSE